MGAWFIRTTTGDYRVVRVLECRIWGLFASCFRFKVERIYAFLKYMRGIYFGSNSFLRRYFGVRDTSVPENIRDIGPLVEGVCIEGFGFEDVWGEDSGFGAEGLESRG